MAIEKFKYQNWNHRRVIVVTSPKGERITWRYVKGSGIQSKFDAQVIFNNTGTLYEDRFRDVRLREKVSEVSNTRKVKNIDTPLKSRAVPRPRKEKLQYMFTGEIGGKLISGRSHRLGTHPNAMNPKDARAQAWINFQKAINNIFYDIDVSDADEGLKVIDSGRVTNVSEGWVYYK